MQNSSQERGVSGRDSSLPDQGAVDESQKGDETKRQSCHRSRQLRIRLPGDRAKDLLELKPSEREHVMELLRNESVDFTKAAELVTELRGLRVVLINALHLSRKVGAVLDVGKIEGAIKRVTELLGGSR